MCYDLTSLLITISAASASFSAILGGIIGSKLLSLNGERDMLAQKLYDLTEEINLKQRRKTWLEDQINTDIALIFIRQFVPRLLSELSLESLPKDDKEKSKLAIEVLLPYWNRALETTRTIKNVLRHRDYSIDSSGMPTEINTMKKEDPFQIEVVSAVMTYIHDCTDDRLINWGISRPPTPHTYYPPNKILDDTQHDEYTIEIRKISWEIEQIELQKKLAEQKAGILQRPHGIKLGLWVFSIFSALNIILPLLLCNFEIENSTAYHGIKYGSIVLLALGLLATLGYLIYMWNWNPIKKNNFSIEKGH